jgi:glycosyltransferase involved in cell wall biosynthesis
MKETARVEIIFLTSSMQIGGQEQYIAQQIMNLDGERFHPILCCLKTEGPMAESVKAAGVEVFSGFQRFKYDLWSLWRLTRFLSARKPDILYIFDFRNVLFIGRLAAKIARIPVIVIACHKMNLNGTGRSYKRLDRLLMSLCDHVIAAAEAHRESLIKNDGIRPDKVTAIHNGIQLSRIASDLSSPVSREDIGVPETARIVGTVARLSPMKSQDILLDAFRIVINRLPNTHLILVGDGPERRKLEAKAVEMEMGEHVHFLGFKKRVAPIVKLFDVFTLSSTTTELFSAATLEAMALAKPVVVTNVGSMSEMVVQGETGFLVPPFDTPRLAERILDVLETADMGHRMGQAARARVEKYFTAEREVRQIEGLFEELLTQAKGSI